MCSEQASNPKLPLASLPAYLLHHHKPTLHIAPIHIQFEKVSIQACHAKVPSLHNFYTSRPPWSQEDQSTATSISRDLPLLPKIWLQTVLTHLTHHDIKGAYLTCQSLRQMAQPHLFHTLTFFPYTFDRHLEIRRLPGVDVIQRSLHKLFFCSSSQLIAPAVKRLIISPSLEPISEDGENENFILDHILNDLHNFVNLATVISHHIWFTSQHLIM